MIRRLIGCAVVLVLLVVGLFVWQIRAPAPAMPSLRGEVRSASLVVDGRQRSFAYYVPQRVRPNPPLLFVLHGSMMNGKRMRMQTGYAFDQIADREGFVVAYPDGFGGYWNECRVAGDYEAKRLAIDDVAFFRALADWFRGEHKTSEVFAAGVSNGGQMAYRLGLEAPDLVRGIAAIAANLPTPENQKCKPSGRPVPTMIVNGTDDPLNPHEGGEVALYGLFLKRGTVQSTLATASYWANLAGHRGSPVAEQIPDHDPDDGATATRHRWPSVALIVVNGGGHTVPHPNVRAPRLLGRTCRDFSAAEEIWKFWSAAALPPL